MIIFLSDHGFSWGSHRWVRKWCVYEECIKFPLVIRYPGLVGNRTEGRIVSNVDIASTIAKYVGIEEPGLLQNGKSFIPVITDTATDWVEEAYIERHYGRGRIFDGIRVPGWTYTEAGRAKELYDLIADPYQLQNRANDPAYQAIQSELAQRMRELKGS